MKSNLFSRFMPLILVAIVLCLGSFNVLATDDDITTVTTSVAGYWTAIKAVSIAVLLFVIGRRVLKKL